MNKYENMGKGGHEADLRERNLYHEVSQIITQSHPEYNNIMTNKNVDLDSYCLNDQANKIIDSYVDKNGKNRAEVVITILDKFNKEYNALPGRLGDEYVKYFFSPEAVKAKMDEANADIYKAIALLKEEVGRKKIFLDNELITKAVDEVQKYLEKLPLEDVEQ